VSTKASPRVPAKTSYDQVFKFKMPEPKISFTYYMKRQAETV